MQGNNACSLKASIFVRTFKVLHSSSCFSSGKKSEHGDLVLSLMRAIMLERLASLTMSLLTWTPPASSLARWTAHLSGLARAWQVGGQVHGQRVWPVDRRVEIPPLGKHLKKITQSVDIQSP